MKLIAEIGINHNGDIEIAKKLITMAKGCGAWAVKFQKRTIDKVYSHGFLASPRESPWGKTPVNGFDEEGNEIVVIGTQREQKEGLEFGRAEYDEIDKFCRHLDIIWFASAWDLESLAFLESYHPQYHKIASAMLTNLEFLEAVARLKRTTFISTGMCDFRHIVDVVRMFRSGNCPFILMHCVSLIPCPDEFCNVSMVKMLKGSFPNDRVGYSGHERGIMPSLVAVAYGAEYIERHITLDRTMYGSDQAASLEAPGVTRLIEYAKQVETCIGDGRKEFGDMEKEIAKKLRHWEEVP